LQCVLQCELQYVLQCVCGISFLSVCVDKVLSPSTNVVWIRCVAVRIAVRAVVRAVLRVAVHVAARVAVCLRCLFGSFCVDEVLSPSTHLL